MKTLHVHVDHYIEHQNYMKMLECLVQLKCFNSIQDISWMKSIRMKGMLVSDVIAHLVFRNMDFSIENSI